MEEMESGRGNDGSCSVLPSFYRIVEILHNSSIHDIIIFAFVGNALKLINLVWDFQRTE